MDRMSGRKKGEHFMQRSRPTAVTLVAILQFIPAFLLPPKLLLSVNPLLLIVPLVFFAFLGWALLTLRRWALTLCAFVQGLNVIARFLILFPQAVSAGDMDWPFVATSLVAILLSALILVVVDRPGVHVAFA
jgi:hypothetical protein